MHKLGFLAVALFGVTNQLSAEALTWTTEQITTNADPHRWALHASVGRIAWAEASYGQDDEIWYYDGTSLHQLTDNNVDEYPRDMGGGAVVWKSQESGAWKLYVHRDGTTTEIDPLGREPLSPRISGSNVAWYGRQSSPYQDDIFYYDGTSVHQVTDDSNADLECDISVNKIAWRRWDGSGYEVFTHQLGGSINNLSDSTRWASKPGIDSDTIAWIGEVRPNVAMDVFCHYAGTIRQLTNLGYLAYEVEPVVSGSKVAWCSKVGGSSGIPNIYLYDAETDTTITLASNVNCQPQIDGDYVVWTASDGHDGEVFLYDGDTVHQITDDDVNYGGACISGNMIVFGGVIDQFGNNHLYATKLFVVPEPATLGLMLIAGVALLCRRGA
jgi:hypothetical protein